MWSHETRTVMRLSFLLEGDAEAGAAKALQSAPAESANYAIPLQAMTSVHRNEE